MITEDHSHLHAIYVQITNRPTVYDMSKCFAWQAWVAKGWTEADLRLVVTFILRRIKEGRRWPESLRFTNLIHDHDRFEEDLIDARAYARMPNRNTDRASVLRSTGRVEASVDTVRSAEIIILGNLELKKLIELRDTL